MAAIQAEQVAAESAAESAMTTRMGNTLTGVQAPSVTTTQRLQTQSPTAAPSVAPLPCSETKLQYENMNCGQCGKGDAYQEGGHTCKGLKDLYRLSACPCPR
jgi:hypothetical protein